MRNKYTLVVCVNLKTIKFATVQMNHFLITMEKSSNLALK